MRSTLISYVQSLAAGLRVCSTERVHLPSTVRSVLHPRPADISGGSEISAQAARMRATPWEVCVLLYMSWMKPAFKLLLRSAM